MNAVDWSASFDELRPGQVTRTRARTITEADVVGFATLTGDRHSQHVDAVWASASRFGERIAHGMLILSYAVGLMPFDSDRVVALRRVGDVVFKRPVRIGETIGAEGTIAKLVAIDEQTGLVGCAWSVQNQDHALVCRAQIDVLWRRGEALSGAPKSARGASSEEGCSRCPSVQQEAISYPRGVFPC